MAAGDALLRALYGQGRPRGVERGIGGKELRFQRNRQFGPGAFPPYGPAAGEPRRYSRPAGGGFRPTGRFGQKYNVV